MALLESMLATTSHRTLDLWLALMGAILLGWWLGSLAQAPRVAEKIHGFAGFLHRKLNRSRRDTTTRAWRGAIATLALVVPAIGVGLLLAWWLAATTWLVVLAVLVCTTGPYSMFALWRDARRGRLRLQPPHITTAFADTHALLRASILDHATRFSQAIIGVGFWYVLAGAPGMLAYLALAISAAHYATDDDTNTAFGGVAAQLFALADAIPKRIAATLLLVAALVVPGTRPRTALRSWFTAPTQWPLFIARLLDISLGGPMPAAHGTTRRPWVGEGIAKLETRHLTCWLLLWAVALLILLVVLPLPAWNIANTLK